MRCDFRNDTADFRVITRNLKFSVRNITRGTALGAAIHLADTSKERRTGLLKRNGLERGEGLWIVPCEGIHTFFMRFAIDVVYLDRKRRVRKAVRALAPWRLSFCITAHSVLELAAGEVDRTATAVGDQLDFEA
jgi:uncharacterized membrane protein (UPF0127 family)